MTKTVKNTNTKSIKPHKYRVNVYLGKDLYDTINGMAQFMGIPLATATRILLETGVNIGMSLDRKGIEGLREYGKSKV